MSGGPYREAERPHVEPEDGCPEYDRLHAELMIAQRRARTWDRFYQHALDRLTKLDAETADVVGKAELIASVAYDRWLLRDKARLSMQERIAHEMWMSRPMPGP